MELLSNIKWYLDAFFDDKPIEMSHEESYPNVCNINKFRSIECLMIIVMQCQLYIGNSMQKQINVTSKADCLYDRNSVWEKKTKLSHFLCGSFGYVGAVNYITTESVIKREMVLVLLQVATVRHKRIKWRIAFIIFNSFTLAPHKRQQ